MFNNYYNLLLKFSIIKINLQKVNWNELNKVIPLIKEANSITINPIDNDNATINLKNKYF
jgi:hypothetical protein